MVYNRFLRNISANTLQIVVNQIFGLAIFYALSRAVDKSVFGEINWALAVLLTSFGVLTFGMDQITIKKIAAGFNPDRIFSAFLHHVLISGFLFYFILLVLLLLVQSDISQKMFLGFIGIGKLAIYFSTPFKHLSAALERFDDLSRMSVVSNIVRGSVLILLLFFDAISLSAILITFISGDILELIYSYYITRKLYNAEVVFKWNKRDQIKLMKESLPQMGVVFFTVMMSRLDWILIGLLVSDLKLAEYSFAYKVFEMTTLPLLILAPMLIPLFARLSKTMKDFSYFDFILKWQVVLASFIGLVLNLSWVPVINKLSDGKYGVVNSNTIFILSLSMPMLYFNNYLWTIQFAKGRMRTIFLVMSFSLFINILGCLILIPRYQNEGAAFAYLITILLQAIAYYFSSPRAITKFDWQLLLWPLTALTGGYFIAKTDLHPFIQILTSTGLFFVVLLLSGALRIKDWTQIQSVYK